MKITVAGGGNIGTQFMVHCAPKGHEVTAYTSTPEVFCQHLNIVDENGRTTPEGKIQQATDDPKAAFMDAVIGVVPGNGGSECAFCKCIGRGNVFFGIERVPAVARLVEKGRTVRSTGYREELHIASIPGKYVEHCCGLVRDIFDMPCKPIPNFLNLTMTPSNPILHTARLYTLFHDYHEGVTYGYVPLFYEEWCDPSSELLLSCDEEVQKICRTLPEFQLEYVKSLRDHYESRIAFEMTKKISSIAAFKGLSTPDVKVGSRFIPDLYSTYFTADFSYGLTVIRQIAEFARVDTPDIDRIMDWYKGIAVEQEEFRFEDYGIQSRLDFEKFYLL